MKRKYACFLAGLLVLSLAGCKNLVETAQEKKYTPPEGVTLMPENQIRDTIVGNTYAGDSVRHAGSTYMEYIHPDGRISGLWNGTERYTGSWALSGSVWCYRYQSTRGCTTLAKSGDTIRWYRLDGSYRGGESIVTAGDTHNLAR